MLLREKHQARPEAQLLREHLGESRSIKPGKRADPSSACVGYNSQEGGVDGLVPARAAPFAGHRVIGRLFLLAGLLAIVGLLLLGIPGALWLSLASPVARLLSVPRAPADAGWPMAIWVTIIWPWLLPLSYAVSAQRTTPGRQRVLAVLVMSSFGSCLVALALQLIGGRV